VDHTRHVRCAIAFGIIFVLGLAAAVYFTFFV
jgi:hypothetical protein